MNISKLILSFLLITPISLFSIQVSNSDYIVADLVSVHDGDTFTVNIRGWHPVVGNKMPVRIKGIDTPEITDDRPEIKEKAIQAKKLLKSSLDGKIRLYRVSRDKYFRLNADVFVKGKDIGKILLESGLAKPYDGGTKSPW